MFDRPRAAPCRRVLLGTLGGLLLVLGVTAVEAPPNSLDSLTYHMPRVVHWMQNASVGHYPTYELRQLYLQPGAEFALLHLQLLSGGDHLAGLVQWGSMLGALTGTSLIARELGANQFGQLLAAIVAASLPIGILESTSTQNDYVVSFWLVCVVAFGLRLLRAPSEWPSFAAFGASTGLALVTKATAYLFVLPVLVWIGGALVNKLGRKALLRLAVAAMLALALNAGFYLRNATLFGSPLGVLDEGTPSTHYLNDRLTPSLFVSNVVRNLGLNFVATPLPPVNSAAERAVLELHRLLQVDAADPSTTWGSETFSARAAGLAFDENFASNPLHLLLLLTAVLAILRRRRLWPAPAVALTLVLGAAFVLFSGLLRWQPWHTRLELPLFVLGAPLVAVVMQRARPGLGAPLAGLLLASMLPWVGYNQARPLFGPRSIMTEPRLTEYFMNQPGLSASYAGAAERLADQGCGRIGLLPGGYEYLVWAVLRQAVPSDIQIESVAVNNVSARLREQASVDFRPCAVLAFNQAASDQAASDQAASTRPVEFHGRTYQLSWSLQPVLILT
jgi:4-amino-4-deoxy-L-arabinose transferase-like glycosyltransferase